jgi:transcriptional regulator with XRE-family HTH domain
LRKKRLTRGWSQKDLAILLGVARQTITSVENGSRIGSTALWDRLELALGASQRWLRKLDPSSPSEGAG